MEFVVAILIIALIAAIAFAVMQRRPAGTRGALSARPFGRRTRGIARRDPMAAAVVEHAEATHPADVVVAEQRLQSEARQVAAGLQAKAQPIEDQRVADAVDGHGAHVLDPALEQPPPDDRRR